MDYLNGWDLQENSAAENQAGIASSNLFHNCLTEIHSWGVTDIYDISFFCKDCKNLTTIPSSSLPETYRYINSNNNAQLNYRFMFYDAINLSSVINSDNQITALLSEADFQLTKNAPTSYEPRNKYRCNVSEYRFR